MLRGHPRLTDTEVRVHKWDNTTVLVSSTQWHQKQTFWVSRNYVHELAA